MKRLKLGQKVRIISKSKLLDWGVYDDGFNGYKRKDCVYFFPSWLIELCGQVGTINSVRSGFGFKDVYEVKIDDYVPDMTFIPDWLEVIDE